MVAQGLDEMKGIDRMHITPVIPDGYHGGPIKQLTCRICKRLFYITQADFDRLQDVRYCHECSLILLAELSICSKERHEN